MKTSPFQPKNKIKIFFLAILFLLANAPGAFAAPSVILSVTYPAPTTQNVSIGYAASLTARTFSLTATNGTGSATGTLSVDRGTWTVSAGLNSAISSATLNSTTPNTVSITNGKTSADFSLYLDAGEPGGTYTVTFSTSGLTPTTYTVFVSDPYVISSASPNPASATVSYGYSDVSTATQFSLIRSGTNGSDPSKSVTVNGGNWTLTAGTSATVSGATLNSTTPQTVTLTAATGNFGLKLNAGSAPGTYTASFGSPALATYTVTVNAATISSSVISGVTAPVTGATPVNVITDDSQFSGTVSWSPSASTFAAGTVYTATITLSPKPGYTFNGVSSNFFTVSGATATNIVNSGVITAVFPATASNYQVASASASPTSSTATYNDGSTPTSTITLTRSGGSGSNPTATISVSSGQWTVTQGSNTTLSGSTLNPSTPVTVWLTAASGQLTLTFNSGQNVGTYTATIGSVTPATYSVTVNSATITNSVISGVTIPVTGATPVTSITENSQFTGTVAWSPSASSFAAGTVYTATITLTPKAGYTLTGVPSNFFTVAGASSVSNSADSGVITATFPATASNFQVASASASQPTATVDYGYVSTPISTITLTRSGGTGSNPTATISVSGGQWTVTSGSGTSLAGTTLNSFTPVTVTLTAASGQLTLALNTGQTLGTYTAIIGSLIPATYSVTVNAATISSPTISGVTAPVTGATPVTSITENSQFTGSVAWSGSPAIFAAGTVYTATITLTPKAGYTLTGVTSNFFTIVGATSVTNSANSGIITATFPVTNQDYSISSVVANPTSDHVSTGYPTSPSSVISLTRTGNTGPNPVVTISVSDGTWTTTPGTNTKLASGSVATVTSSSTQQIELTEATGSFTLSLNLGASAGTYVATIGTQTLATFTVTATDVVIDHSTITGLTVPVTGAIPVTAIIEDSQFTGSVSWSPSAGTFAPATVYTATITLAPKAGYTLNGVSSNFFTVSGATATNSANSGVITAVFPVTNQDFAISSAVAYPTSDHVKTGYLSSPSSVISLTRTGNSGVNPNIAISVSGGTWTLTPGMSTKIASGSSSTVTSSGSQYIELTDVSGDFTLSLNLGASAGTYVATIGNQTLATFTVTASDVVIDQPTISGVSAPTTDATPVNNVTETDEYTGTVVWSGSPTHFLADTEYTATITLTPKPGYTLTGVAANFFKVSGATTSNNANSGVLTAVFPVTAAHYSISNATPSKSSATISYGYKTLPNTTFTLTRSGGALPTPIVVISAASGEWSVAEGTNTHISSSVLNKDNTVTVELLDSTGDVTVTFNGGQSVGIYTVTLGSPGLASYSVDVIPTVITYSTILGLIAPVTGAIPVASITGNDQFTGSVEWSDSPYTFAAGTQYKATITLAPTVNYTFDGLAPNYFEIAGAVSVKNEPGSNIVTAKFPTTNEDFALASASASSTSTSVKSGYLISPNTTVSLIRTGNFGSNPKVRVSVSAGTWTITVGAHTSIAADSNATVTSSSPQYVELNDASGDFTLNLNKGESIGSYTASIGSPILTTFNVLVEPTTITTSTIAGVITPVTGATPVTSITETDQFTGTVTWSGSPLTFPAGTIETATVTLTAKSGYTLVGISEDFFTIAGATFVTHASNSGVITAVFATTEVEPTPTPSPTQSTPVIIGGGGGSYVYTPVVVPPTPTPTATPPSTPTPTASASPSPNESATTSVTPSATPAVTPVASISAPLSLPVSVDIAPNEAKELLINAPTSAGTFAPVSLSFPRGLINGNANVRVTSVLNSGATNSGLVNFNIEVTDAIGKSILEFDLPLTITLSTEVTNFVVAESEDGVVWNSIPLISGTTLPFGYRDGYYIDSFGRVVILTKHVSQFGLKVRQGLALAASGVPNELALGKGFQLSLTGGSGNGAIRYRSMTPLTCAVSSTGLITGIKTGSCIIASTKEGDVNYMKAELLTSLLITTTPVKNLGVYGTGLMKKIFVNLGSTYAGKKVQIQEKRAFSTTYRTVATLMLDSRGRLTTMARIATQSIVRVRIDNKTLASITVYKEQP